MQAAFFADANSPFSNEDLEKEEALRELRDSQVICCCKKDKPHDESLKFVLKVTQEYQTGDT